MNRFERKAASSGRKVVDLAVQVFGHKPQIEGLRGIDDLWQYMEVSGNAREILVQVSCESRITRDNPPGWSRGAGHTHLRVR